MVKRYLLVTFSITFLFWGTIAVYTQLENVPFSSSIIILILYLLGVIGPAIASIIVRKKHESREDFRKFLKSCYRPPKKIKWYLFVLIIVFVSSLLPYFIVGGEQVAPVLNILFSIPLFILVGGLEEIGWRGFMLLELSKRISAPISTLLVGVVWIVWHVPLFFIIGTYQYEHLNIFPFAISVISLSFLLATVYYKTNSIFLCIITHALYNSVLDVFIVNQSLFGEIIVFIFSLFVFFLFINKRNQAVISIE